jgi:uncharacterized membrane protein YoaK (UPF0700 family)
MSADIHSPDKWLSFGLAFVGGFGDAAGFVLAKTFTGHITGSLVLGAIATVAHDWRGSLAHFSAMACFLAGIPLSFAIPRLLVVWPRWRLLPAALAIELILFGAAYFVLAFHFALGVEVFVICFSLALGLQNGAFRRTGGISVHTNYLTGMITGLLVEGAEKHGPPVIPHFATAIDPKISLLYGIWGMFFLGAATGAAMVFRFKERGILVVIFLLCGLIVRNLTAPLQADSTS